MDMERANINSGLVNQIKSIIEQSQQNVAVTINRELIRSYWEIGKLIVDCEQENNYYGRSEYAFMLALSKLLTSELGKGFSRPNLVNMKNLYVSYPSCQTLSDNLSWSHYCKLLLVEDNDARGFYEKECQNSRWSVRELHRQIESVLFQRLLLSDGTLNKQKVIELSR